MPSTVAHRPDPSTQRKAAIAGGGAFEHSGEVRIDAIENFDLGRTIFKTLEGSLARFVVTQRVAREVHWDPAAAQAVQTRYEAARTTHPLPEIKPALLRFLIEECDFDVEHADGSFLDHLYFCFEYAVQHYPGQPPLVQFLHSILGTGTNTFAMQADKIPALQALLSHEEWVQIEAFPSVLRLLYAGALRRELRANLHRADALRSVSFHRVIDNAPITLSGDAFWVALNHQLIHLVDFLPVANWSLHRNDPLFMLFRDLHDLLEAAGRREAQVSYTPFSDAQAPVGEPGGLGAWLTARIPGGLAERLTAKSVMRFSERIGHSLAYRIAWA